MMPDRQEAKRLLAEAERMNPGPWGNHSRTAAECAEKIAVCCDMDGEKAYILGLLHDIGRREGVTSIAHILDGYRFLTELGYEEAARICITHSFAVQDIGTYIGKIDVMPQEYKMLSDLILSYTYDDYDRLIQLCDSIAFPTGVVDLKTRMDDVERRYGGYPAEKRQKHYDLKTYFEKKMNRNLYEVCGM